MDRTILYVGLGGMLGSMARYAATLAITKVFPTPFPYGTFAVNIAGCLVIGLIFGWSQRYEWLTPEWRFFLATGFCGGFTTFSSFALENMLLLHDRHYVTFAAYAILSFVLCMAAVFAGFAVARQG